MSNPIPTLRGMFSVPRATQGRNFLKENKINLRSLEKATTQKLAAKEPVRPKWMQPLRRTASEVRETKGEKERQTTTNTRQQQQQQQLRLARSHSNFRSQQHLDVVVPKASEPEEILEAATPPEGRCQSCGSQRSSTSIGIQTEDITDEIYLTKALKKCSIDGRSLISDDNNYRYHDDDDDQLPLSPRSSSSNKHLNLYPMDELETINHLDVDDAQPLSARSRATITSSVSNITTITNKSRRREHKLGARDDVRLPRYLEKEKRDKAEAKLRADARDPDCPRGHIVLSEQDRLTNLNNAQKRFDSLVNELNHMPMTTQTLRVRTRKAEIDKELATVEEEIRTYSKPKVYIPSQQAHQL
ncbi:uncharacterized protein Dwil_GK21321 [Drosophila willistoni]|uniref:GK21321 n=1 Tax=Drosophila willistoni TaxID=7260 RepID=B4MR66_DROWI|nr:uncharacterized protein LOC6640369 [Drosophila willistoni]EDW74605.1 uncharacterized protein Dwil_GK21321 [Drosophila willistoni]